MIVLTDSDVSNLLSRTELIEAVRRSMIDYSNGRTVVPRRVHLDFGESPREALVMPGYLPDDGVVGAKLLTVAPLADGATVTRGLMVLFDADTGEPTAIVDAAEITEERTAAMTRLACRELAVPAPRTLSLIGTGVQARVHLVHLHEEYPELAEIRVFGRNQDRLTGFVEWARERGAPAVAVGSIPEGIAGAEIVVAATTATEPLFEDADVAPDAMVCGVGSHAPQAAEIPPETVARARAIVVDTREGALGGSGDISIPIADGLVSLDSVLELGEVLGGESTGSQDGRPVVFKSVGFAAADLSVAALLLPRAQAGELGTEIEW